MCFCPLGVSQPHYPNPETITVGGVCKPRLLFSIFAYLFNFSDILVFSSIELVHSLRSPPVSVNYMHIHISIVMFKRLQEQLFLTIGNKRPRPVHICVSSVSLHKCAVLHCIVLHSIAIYCITL